MNRRGRRWNDIKHTSLEEHGVNIAAIKEWRKRESDSGRPSELIDFFRQHGLCHDCQCTGAKIVDWDGEIPLWDTCVTCGGSGTV